MVTEIWLGSRERALREQAFADGALVVRSAKGLRATERALLGALPRGRRGSALVLNSVGAVAGMALRALNPELSVHCHFDDAWGLGVAERAVGRQPALAPSLAVGPDPPAGPWGLVVLPFERDGVRALLRERLSSAVGWLAPRGLLFASTGNARDRFLRDEVRAVFGPLSIVAGRSRRGGVAYIARRPARPGKLRSPGHRTFTVRDGDRTVTLTSRPGVFCHGRVDAGTHALLRRLEVGAARRVLDLGCGTGVLGIVAALRSPEARATLIDSYARAVECARRNVAANGVAERCEVVLAADSQWEVGPGFDLVVTNPPYYGNYRISEMFLATAAKALVPGGRLVVVTKGVEWHERAMRQRFGPVGRADVGGYAILEATRGGAA